MIRYNDRVLVLGPTGCGKSALLNHLVGQLRCQRLILDTKDDLRVPGVSPVSDPAAIDWSLPVIHFRDPPGGGAESFDRLFGVLMRRSGLVVACHELPDLCEHMPNKTPPQVRGYFTKGRAKGLGMLGGAQRPVSLPRVARTEAQHLYVFPRLDPDDREVVARIVGQSPDTLGQLLDRIDAEHGEHGFLAWSQRDRTRFRICPPLPPRALKQSIVQLIEPK